jgi:hypothetical protein
MMKILLFTNCPLLTGDPRAGMVCLGSDGCGETPDVVVRRDQFDPWSSSTGHAGVLEHPVGDGCTSTSVQVKADPRCGRCQLPMKSSGVAPPPDGPHHRESRSVVTSTADRLFAGGTLRDKGYLNVS